MVKKLMACLGDAKRDAILSPVFVVGEVVMEVLIPLLMADIIDNGVQMGDAARLRSTGLWLVLATVASLVCGALAGHFSAHAAARFGRNLRRAQYSRVQQFSFANIDHFSTSGLVTRMTTDVTNLQMAFMMVIRIAVRAPVMLLAALGMAFSINARLGLVYLACIPLLGGVLLLIASRAHPLFEKVFRTYDRLNQVVQESLRGIRVVKSFVRQDKEIEKFDGVSQKIYKLFSRAERLLAFNSPSMQLAMYTCMILISWLGAQMIVGGTFTTGKLMSMISYAMQILSSLMMISMVFVMIIMSRASGERVAEVLDEESTITDPERPIEKVADGSIVFEQVGFAYGSGPETLADIDLYIPSGSTVGIVGGTGSAKTSLVQLIPRLYDVTRGRVLVGGVDVRRYGLHALRDQVAMVLQNNQLFAGTISENLRRGNEKATDEQRPEAGRMAQADEFIRQLPGGYESRIEQGGSNVSGGQKQRLCIARALLKQPRILILDDSTSAVDTRTDALIREAMARYMPQTTKLIIAQRISSVEHADMILVMDGGRIAAKGTHEELLKSCPLYREVWQSQQKGDEEHEN